jgi:hypothetical protein
MQDGDRSFLSFSMHSANGLPVCQPVGLTYFHLNKTLPTETREAFITAGGQESRKPSSLPTLFPLHGTFSCTQRKTG